MAIIEAEIFRALGYLLIAYIIYTAWKLAYTATAKIGFKKSLLQGLLWCVGIALFSTLTLGTHTETIFDGSDDGRSDTFQDYKPTNTQRVARFSYVMTLLYIPVIVGTIKRRAYSKFKENSDKK